MIFFLFFPSCPSCFAKCKQRLRNIFVTSSPKAIKIERWDEHQHQSLKHLGYITLCSGPEPKKCFACKEGFIMHAEHGCQDIDECQASGGKVCETNQFCMNLGQDHLFTSLACYHVSRIAWHFFVTEEHNFVSQWCPIEGVRQILDILIGQAANNWPSKMSSH